MCYSNQALLSVAPKACPQPSSNIVSMNRFSGKIVRWLLVVAFAYLMAASAQAQGDKSPMLQDLQVSRERYSATPSATPLVTKTAASAPLIANPNNIRTLFPILADVQVPGNSGILIENLDGAIVLESNASGAFNPASNVKIATAYAVLKTFGPDFRFRTDVYTDGALDTATGTLTGNIYVSGKDPMFGYQHAVAIAHELNRLGIRAVTGDLIVTDNFVMNYSSSPASSGQALLGTLNAAKRNAAATRNWNNHLSYSGKLGQVQGTPSVAFMGSAFVQPIPSNLTQLFYHESTQMRDILKANLCYSNNFLSERLGGLIGGPWAVARVVHQFANIPPHELSLQTSSGLGINRVTPNAMMKLLRALRNDLAKYKMTFADIMPVAGVDKGTLEDRFDTDFSRGTVVGKTGTLGNTDAGVSSLAGEMNTRNGRLLFVIFNQRGNVSRFRSFQNYFVSLVQGQMGGAAPLAYDPMSLETRLAKSRVVSPTAQPKSD